MRVCGWLQIIVKEKGVFSNVTSPSTKAKLRLLFEVAPLALLVSHHPVCLLALRNVLLLQVLSAVSLPVLYSIAGGSIVSGGVGGTCPSITLVL